MKSPYVSELQPNQIITATFLVWHKDIRQKKTGDPYLTLTLGDRTGEIDARMWDNVAEVMHTFERDDYLRVRGLLQVHHNRLQLTVHKLQRQSADQVDPTDYFPASSRDTTEMLAELRSIVASVVNPHLRGLLHAIFNDEAIATPFRLAPAAKSVHHAYLGGLSEHVLSMCTLARAAAAHYKDVDLDLLIAGVLLHDLGKIHELTWDRSFGYSTEGQLLGHIHIGLQMVDEKLRALPEFPPRLRTLLAHMILSHHGEMEYGSPKVPNFPEALLLHHIDNLDSKMECMRSSLARDRQVDGCWTGYNPALDRSFLKKARYLEDVKLQPDTTGPQPSAPPLAARPQEPRPAAAATASSGFADKLRNALGGAN
ncbi:MAG TPA: HD domain-containing protein [Bryobacteraceae bacterium]|nr:HD domain-containing protein [Bryobacteraceae bacterium]